MESNNDNSMETVFLNNSGQEYLQSGQEVTIQPRLFVCFEHEIMEFILSGKQSIGRPSKGQIPDIPVTNKYVSRKHGYFETKTGKVTYTAGDSKNGTVFRRRKLEPGETVEIWDGDELIIPVSEKEEGVDVMLVCALVESRVNIWRDLKQSARDALTGLPGRNAFRTWFLMNHGWNREEDICLFILDIDHFKGINDVYGHASGDSALKFLAEQLLLTANNEGYICRWGGDEFTGILKGDAETGKKALEEMNQRIGGTMIDDRFSMTISAGVVNIKGTDISDDIDALVMKADKALYNAKENGRNCVCIA